MSRYNLVLMAGRGERFSQRGYTDPKPLIPVLGEPMVVAAIRCLPPADRWGFVCQRDHLERFPLRRSFKEAVGECDVIALSGVTEGQAASALEAESLVDPQAELLIASCDNGLLWNPASWQALVENRSIDAVIWTFRGYAPAARKPTAYSWVAHNDGDVQRVSLKRPLSARPLGDSAVVGTFWFRRAGEFMRAARDMIRRGRRSGSGEFYIDDLMNVLIENGRRVACFDVDHYQGWGTPDELRTFLYWASYFQPAERPR